MDWTEGGDADIVLAFEDSKLEKVLWVLDSGSSRHLVGDARLLKDADGYNGKSVAANGAPSEALIVGAV